jgi:sigma-B regulation protein RsbU (phosphoserine phosphatase)
LNSAACPISNCSRHRGGLAFLLAALAWLSLALMPNGLAAQTFDATNLRQPAELAATWLVHAGDDPAYARPDFDDSGWMKFDSTKDLHDLFPHDHPEVVWYRLHVNVAPGQTNLALKEQFLSNAFEIYSNGTLLMKLGQIQPLVAYTPYVPLIATIPAKQIATASVVIALRVHIAQIDWMLPRPGFDSVNLIIGREPEFTHEAQLGMFRSQTAGFVTSLLFLGLSIVVFALYLTQPRQREYLWLALHAFMSALGLIFNSELHNFPARWLVLEGIRSALVEVFGFLMYSAFLRRSFGWRTKVYIAIASALMVVGVTIDQDPVKILAETPLHLLTNVFVLFILIRYFRRGNREAGILLIPMICWCVIWVLGFGVNVSLLIPSISDRALHTFWAITTYRAGPITLRIWDLTSVLYLLSFAIIIVLRSGRLSRQRAVIDGELAAAREVQQVLVPEQIERVPGFAIESAYQPAREVGGDFFQILPDGEGGLLAVVGDVAGKGLPAAMLVSVLVGSIRSTAEFTKDPAELLGHLNERLLGRTKGGFSTILAARISADGSVLLANAGHLPPYLDGREVELPGALPLGVLKGASYEVTRFNLARGSRLTFYTDGVVEAQNQKGELFGFERGRSVSTRTAVAIVEEAQQFGQSDDITVVTVERLVAVEEAAASRTAPIVDSEWDSMALEPLGEKASGGNTISSSA